MGYKKQKHMTVEELAVITPDRLKPCGYCRAKPTVRPGKVWRFMGCDNPKCIFNPRTLYKVEEEQEVFGNWNRSGGDVEIGVKPTQGNGDCDVVS